MQMMDARKAVGRCLTAYAYLLFKSFIKCKMC